MSDWNASNIEELRANAGHIGGPFEGAPIILIDHIGAKPGTERVNPLRYFSQDDGSVFGSRSFAV